MTDQDKPYRNRPDDDLSVSLNKLTGKKVVDLEGYISDPYGGGALLNLHRVVFDDGTYMWFGGAHDLAYVYPVNSNPENAQFVVDIDTLYPYDEDGDG